MENRRFPHTCTITRDVASDPMEDEGQSEVLYQGECRCYPSKDTTVGKEYDVHYRELSIPLTNTGWTRNNVPNEYDRVEVDYGTYTEILHIVRLNLGNFGSHFSCRKD